MKLLSSLTMNGKTTLNGKLSQMSICKWSIYFIALLMLMPGTLKAADNRLDAFCKLSRPEKCWVLTHPFKASRAWKSTKLTRQITFEVAQDSLLDGDVNGGQLDAFRHTFWLATLSQKMRWKKAWRLAEAHEKGNYLAYKNGKMEDGSLADSASSEMDRFNNQLGIEIGRKNKMASQESLSRLVIKAILDGQARVLSKNIQGEYLDCEHKIISDSSGKWNIPKCLIPSNIPRE